MIVGLFALAALVARWRSGEAIGSWLERAQASLYAGTPLLALVVVYWAFALTTNLNIGHRHLLPTYPALCILAGGAAFWIQPLFEGIRKAEPQTGRERRQQRSEAGVQRTASGSLKTAGVATSACWRGTWRSRWPSARTTWRTSINWRAAPRRATSIWPTVRWTGDRICRRSSGGSTARDCSNRARAACTCRTSARPVPSTTGYRPRPGGFHRPPATAAARTARRRRLLRQRHRAGRHRHHVLQAGVREQLPGGPPEHDDLRPCLRERQRPGRR